MSIAERALWGQSGTAFAFASVWGIGGERKGKGDGAWAGGMADSGWAPVQLAMFS
jgi:hypothetical protein